MTGSVIGRAPPGPVNVLCRPDVKLERELMLLGKLRKVLQALVFRHRSSSASLMMLRYVSSPLRRSSVNSGEEVVRVNHDLEGSWAGGRAPA